MSQDPIPIIQIEPATAGAAELARVLARSGQMEIFAVSSADEARQVAEQFLPCVLLVSLSGVTVGKAELELVRKMEKTVRAARLKVIVLSAVKKHPLAASFSELGVTDYIEEPAPLRSLLFKANLAVKGVLAARRRESAHGAAEETLVFKATAPAASEGESAVNENKPKFKPALQLGEDTFVFRAAVPRKIGKKYTLEAEGPDPEEGTWVADDAKGRGVKRAWRWKPRGEVTSPEKDGWIHEGDEPQFDPVARKWQLRSEKPSLTFRRKGKAEAVKVETDEDGAISIAEDSETALRKVKAREEKAREIWRKAQEVKAAEELAAALETEPVSTASVAPEWAVKLSPAAPGAPDEVPESADGKDAPDAAPSLALKRRAGRRSRAGGMAETAEDEEKKIREARDRDRADRDAAKDPRARGAGPEAEEDEPAAWNELESDDDEEEGETPLRQKNGAPARKKRSARPIAEGAAESLPEDETDVAGATPEERQRKRAERLARAEKKAIAARKGASQALEPETGLEETQEGDAPEKRRAARAKARRLVKERQRVIQDAEEQEDREERAERELAERDDPEISPERAAQRAAERLARARERALRREARRREKEVTDEELAALDEEELAEPDDGRQADVTAAELNIQEPGEAAERQFRAIDSIEEGAGEVLWGGADVEDRKKKTRRSAEAGVEEVLVPRPEILPLDASWESCDDYFAFIPDRVFAEGFAELSGILPVWVYEGSDEPALDGAENYWRFRKHGPRRVDHEADLPAGVLALLLDLKEQADLVNGEAGEALAKRLAGEASALPWVKERAKEKAHPEESIATAAGEAPAKRLDEEASVLAPVEEQANGKARPEERSAPENEPPAPPGFRFKARELLGFVAISDLAQSPLPADERRRQALKAIGAALGGREVQWREGRLRADGCDQRELYVLERFQAAVAALLQPADLAA